VLGKCGAGCSGGQTGCQPEAGSPYCANTQSDNLNCGACFNPCGPQKVCVAGACVGSCVQGQAICAPDGGAPYCAKTDTDNANCGACGVTCGVLEVCAAGKCGSACLVTQTKCAPPDGGVSFDGGPAPSYCADTKSDNANCGACGTVCGSSTPLCVNSVCVSPG